MKRKSWVVVGILMVSAFLLLSCSKANKTAKVSSDKNGGVLVFAHSGDAVGLDPGREDDGETFLVCDNIYETLVEFVPGTTKLQPGLAESYEISKDGLHYTFHLRKNVKFHDGTDFNADAVLYSLNRQFKKDHPSFKYGPWKYWGYMSLNDIVKSINKVDDYTVRIDLLKPESPFLSDLAMNFASIVSPTAAKKFKGDFKNNPCGTGPFKFVKWIKDDSIVLEKFNDYWGQKAYLDKIVFKVIPEPTARYLALKKGEADIIDFPSPQDIQNIKDDASLKIVKQAGLNVGYLAMNTSKKPFNNVLVRQAINYAINKADIMKAVYGDLGQPAKNPLPPTMWAYNNDIKDYQYDPAKAKELLKKAGLPNGFSTTIWAMPVSRPYNPNGRKVAEVIQAQLAKVGIKAKIVSYEWGTYLDKTNRGKHDMALLGWTGDNGDPDNFLWNLLSKDAAKIPAGNIAFWKNDKFTALIKQAKETSIQSKRKELYDKAQVVFHNQVPWVCLAHSVVIEPMKANVMDFKLYPTGKRVFHFVWLKK